VVSYKHRVADCLIGRGDVPKADDTYIECRKQMFTPPANEPQSNRLVSDR
jgi:hypothetical protein